METDRRSFLRAAGSSLILGAGSVHSASAATQAPAAPVSFPGIANPLEGGVEVIATGYIWTEGPVWVGGEDGRRILASYPVEVSSLIPLSITGLTLFIACLLVVVLAGLGIVALIRGKRGV